MSSWKGLQKRVGEFETIGARVLGLASDTQEQLSDLCKQHNLSFPMLSDPMLTSEAALGIPISTKVSFMTALPLHPILRHLPKKAFLQPALLIWKGEQLVYEWRQTEKLHNLLGASGRPSPQDILEISQGALATED